MYLKKIDFGNKYIYPLSYHSQRSFISTIHIFITDDFFNFLCNGRMCVQIQNPVMCIICRMAADPRCTTRSCETTVTQGLMTCYDLATTANVGITGKSWKERTTSRRSRGWSYEQNMSQGWCSCSKLLTCDSISQEVADRQVDHAY